MTGPQNQNPYQQQSQPQSQTAQQQPYQSYQPYGVPQTPQAQMPQVQFPPTAPQPVNGVYPVSENDRQLRLIAFIFMLLSTVSVGWTIVPLAWMIPMTVVCWDIYKGKSQTVLHSGYARSSSYLWLRESACLFPPKRSEK
jgi:hypothetical protein